MRRRLDWWNRMLTFLVLVLWRLLAMMWWLLLLVGVCRWVVALRWCPWAWKRSCLGLMLHGWASSCRRLVCFVGGLSACVCISCGGGDRSRFWLFCCWLRWSVAGCPGILRVGGWGGARWIVYRLWGCGMWIDILHTSARGWRCVCFAALMLLALLRLLSGSIWSIWSAVPWKNSFSIVIYLLKKNFIIIFFFLGGGLVGTAFLMAW